MIKSLFRLSLRMVTGFVKSLIKLCVLNSTAPNISDIRTVHFVEDKNILILRFAIKKVAMGYDEQYITHCRLNCLKFLSKVECKRKKYGSEYRRQWRKLHIRIDAESLQIRAVQLTTNNVSDSQVLEDLLTQIPLDEQIDFVYTDGPYDTKQCRQVITDRQAYVVIPPKKNANPWKDNKIGSLERNELLKTIKRLGRMLWKKWSGYHRRSLVGTKMHYIKLLDDKLTARVFLVR